MVDLDHLITCHLFGNLQGLNQCGKSSHEPFSTLPLSHCHLTTAKSQDSRFNVPINPILSHEKWLMNIFSRVASITPPSPSHPFASNTSPPWPSAHQPSRRHLNVSGHDVGSPKNANASPIRPVPAEALLGSVGLGNKKPLLSQGGAPPPTMDMNGVMGKLARKWAPGVKNTPINGVIYFTVFGPPCAIGIQDVWQPRNAYMVKHREQQTRLKHLENESLVDKGTVK